MKNNFPLRGIIGVVAENLSEVDQALERGLQCVEIRADLILHSGHTIEQLMEIVRYARSEQLAVLFTLRHPTHGGRFEGTEAERAQISEQALENGAHIIDLEFESEASKLVLAKGLPIILSHHDFNAMLSESALAELTQRMLEQSPDAIKVVPTASKLAHAVQMLEWVAKADSGASDQSASVERIGFAMGEAGECSRILTLAHGGAVTYSTFGAPTAPGQIDIDEMLNMYRSAALNNNTQVRAVVGKAGAAAEVARLNKSFGEKGSLSVAIAFNDHYKQELEQFRRELRISEISNV